MLQVTPVPPAGALRAATAIDLIGDLDSILARMFGETLHGIVRRGESDVVVNLSHVSSVHEDGLKAVIRAIVELRVSGSAIAVRAGTRRVRSLLKSARIPCEESATTMGPDRHVMIARHAT